MTDTAHAVDPRDYGDSPRAETATPCLTEMSAAGLVIGALGGSALLWIAVLAVL